MSLQFVGASFDPNQPRDDRGQWTSSGASVKEGAGLILAAPKKVDPARPSIGIVTSHGEIKIKNTNAQFNSHDQMFAEKRPAHNRFRVEGTEAQWDDEPSADEAFKLEDAVAELGGKIESHVVFAGTLGSKRRFDPSGHDSLKSLQFVGAAEFDEEKHPRDEKGQFTTLFHGTTSENTGSIREKGIVPGPNDDLAYASTFFEQAESYAVHRARKEGKKPVVFELSIPNEEAIRIGRETGTALGTEKGFKPEWVKAVHIQRDSDEINFYTRKPKQVWIRRPLKPRTLEFVGAAEADDEPSDYKLSKFAADHAAALMQGTKKERKVVRDEVRKALKNGEGPKQIADRLYEELDRTVEEIDNIAETEYAIAVNGATLQKLESYGAEAKEWVLGEGEEGCPICQALDGQVVGIDEEFENDGDTFDAPPAHPRCQCRVKRADKVLARAAIEFVGSVN